MDLSTKVNGGRRKGAFLVLRPFMWEEFGLRGVELLVYGRIHGFCKDGGVFFESRAATAAYLGISERSVIRAVGSLEDHGLIAEVNATGRRRDSETKTYVLGAKPHEVLTQSPDRLPPPDDLSNQMRTRDDNESPPQMPTWHLKSKDESKGN